MLYASVSAAADGYTLNDKDRAAVDRAAAKVETLIKKKGAKYGDKLIVSLDKAAKSSKNARIRAMFEELLRKLRQEDEPDWDAIFNGEDNRATPASSQGETEAKTRLEREAAERRSAEDSALRAKEKALAETSASELESRLPGMRQEVESLKTQLSILQDRLKIQKDSLNWKLEMFESEKASYASKIESLNMRMQNEISAASAQYARAGVNPFIVANAVANATAQIRQNYELQISAVRKEMAERISEAQLQINEARLSVLEIESAVSSSQAAVAQAEALMQQTESEIRRLRGR